MKTVETHALYIYLVISEATVYKFKFWAFLKQKMKLSKFQNKNLSFYIYFNQLQDSLKVNQFQNEFLLS